MPGTVRVWNPGNQHRVSRSQPPEAEDAPAAARRTAPPEGDLRREKAREEVYGLIARIQRTQPFASRAQVLAFTRSKLGPAVLDPLLTDEDRLLLGLG